MRAGDGIFANCSCYPNIILDETFVPIDITRGDASSDQNPTFITLYKPSRYANLCLHHTLLVELNIRPIRQHEEITLQYNDVRTDKPLDVGEVIGGCFRPEECHCGYPFCMGDVLRRLDDGTLNENDVMFFHTDNTVMLSVNTERYTLANKLYEMEIALSSAVGERDLTVEERVIGMLRAGIPMVTDTMCVVSTLLHRYASYVSPSAYVPMYRRAGHK